jgi:CheY-like chemotaxis protein
MSNFNIVLIEDGPTYTDLIRHCARKVGPDCNVEAFEDGETALEFLDRIDKPEGQAPHTEMPDLIMLDLNLPGIDGFEVLREIKKGSSVLRRVPVIILSSETSDELICTAYDESANSYVLKPSSVKQCEDLMEAVYKFWNGFTARAWKSR